MRIIIKSEDTNINLSVPMWVVTSGIRIAAFVIGIKAKKALKQVNGENKQDSTYNQCKAKGENGFINHYKYLDMIDYKILLKAFKGLKEYKGLTIVDVTSSDGEHILIRV